MAQCFQIVVTISHKAVKLITYPITRQTTKLTTKNETD